MDQPTSPALAATFPRTLVVSVGKTTPSPSGKYQAELVVVDMKEPANRQMVRVRIVPTASETKAFESGTQFATWFPLQVQWDTTDRLWANSSDVGRRVWILHEGNWTEFLWQSDGPKVPDVSRVIWDAQLNRNVCILGIDPPP